MPELPDIENYLAALDRFLGGREIQGVVVRSPFVVRTFDPDIQQVVGESLSGFRRMGKRIVWETQSELRLVFHLMIAGRFHWRKRGAKPRAKTDLIAFEFEQGVMMLTEASPKKRASLHVLRGEEALGPHRRDGLEILTSDVAAFIERLRSENHTVKRALTDPGIFSGVGNAYSDEILHRARLSPLKWTQRMTDEESERLFRAARDTLSEWTERLREQTGDDFPEKVTAFRPEMAVHGKHQEPCPDCSAPVQRIVYANNETNYCARCQTGGKLLADRSLSRLLKDDWPRSLDELE